MGAIVSRKKNKTVVANAFSCEIYAKCEGDLSFKSAECTTEKYSVEVNTALLAYMKQNHSEGKVDLKGSFMKIPTGEVRHFFPNCSTRAYLTIVYLDENNVCQEICCKYEIPENQHVIVVVPGSVKVADGESHWIDKDGHNHEADAKNLSNYQKEVNELKDKYRRQLSDVRKKYGVPRETLNMPT